MTTRTETHAIQVSGPSLNLDDLRWLVEVCKGMSGQSKVYVEKHSDQRDGDYRVITVSGKPEFKVNLHGGGNCR